MGNWRHRPPRRIYRQQWPPRSPPMPCDPEPHHSHSGFGQDGIPLWEKRFCSLIGSVPWRKIVDAKKFMYCHSNVLDWDDTAGEEAFQNAKKRFWAEMNGLYCDIRPADPDIYIDEIDWNPVIDPALIKELDREYFAPDDGEENRKAGRKNKKTRNCVSVPSDDLDNGVNPWECNIIPGTGAWENKPTGLKQWNNNTNGSKNLENKDNPWECNVAQCSGNKEDNAWGDCKNNSWGMGWNWTQNDVDVSQPRNWNDDENRWDRGCQGFASVKNNGCSNSWDKSWGMNKQESKNKESFDNPWKPNVSHQESRAQEDGGWRDYGGVPSCRKQLDHYNNQKKTFEFRRARGDWGDWNEDNSQKRDSHHDINGHGNLRFQGDTSKTGGHNWRGNNKKRSIFALSSR